MMSTKASAGTEVLIPAIWPFEVANALQVTERRKRITVAQVTGLLRRSPRFRFQQIEIRQEAIKIIFRIMQDARSSEPESIVLTSSRV
jgi:hypothetical protein